MESNPDMITLWGVRTPINTGEGEHRWEVVVPTDYRWKDGSPNPGFGDGHLHGSPYSVGYVNYVYPVSTVSHMQRSYRHPSQQGQWQGYEIRSPRQEDCMIMHGMQYSSSGGFSNLSNLKAIAIVKANEKATKSWDVLTSLVELPKTALTVIDLVRGVIPALRRYRKLIYRMADIGMGVRRPRRRDFPDEKTFKRALDLFNEAWLLWRFTIRTTMYDIGDAVSAHEKIYEDKRERFIRSSRGYATATDTVTHSLVWKGTGDWHGTIEGLKVEILTSEARCCITDLLDVNVTVEQLRDAFVQIDPIATAYELIPFSFMVDWFINIGSWLGTFSAIPKMVTERLVTVSVKQRYNNPGWSGGGSVFFYQYDGLWYDERKVDMRLNGSPQLYEKYDCMVYPDIPPTLPPINVRLDLTKWLDILTILSGMTKSKKK